MVGGTGRWWAQALWCLWCYPWLARAGLWSCGAGLVVCLLFMYGLSGSLAVLLGLLLEAARGLGGGRGSSPGVGQQVFCSA